MSQPEQRINDLPFFIYPNKASFGRVIPKNKIYEHTGASSRLKELFVDQVEQVTWQYKLAPETINLGATSSVPEIQIFSVKLRSDELSLDVLRCIDEAVQFPILFELYRNENAQTQRKVTAAYKFLGDTNSNRLGMSSYFSTDWVIDRGERIPLPLALDMQRLYEQLLQHLIPLEARDHETLSNQVHRYEQVIAKRTEVEKLAVKLAKEKQFNRKIEYNSALRQLKVELEALQSLSNKEN